MGMTGRVEGKVAFITGVARGQGRAHAVRLAEEGAHIIGIDVPGPYEHAAYPMASQEDLDETVNLVEKVGGRIVARQGDVRDRPSIAQALADGLTEFGRLDVVVANAGICAMGPRPAEAFLEAIDVDLVGVINTIMAAQPHLGAGASVIVTGSVAAMVPGSVDSSAGGPGGAGYGFSKQTIAKFSRARAALGRPKHPRQRRAPHQCRHRPAIQRRHVSDLPSGPGCAHQRRCTADLSYDAGTADYLHRNCRCRQRRAVSRIRRGTLCHRTPNARRRRLSDQDGPRRALTVGRFSCDDICASTRGSMGAWCWHQLTPFAISMKQAEREVV